MDPTGSGTCLFGLSSYLQTQCLTHRKLSDCNTRMTLPRKKKESKDTHHEIKETDLVWGESPSSEESLSPSISEEPLYRVQPSPRGATPSGGADSLRPGQLNDRNWYPSRLSLLPTCPGTVEAEGDSQATQGSSGEGADVKKPHTSQYSKCYDHGEVSGNRRQRPNGYHMQRAPLNKQEEHPESSVCEQRT